MLKRFSCRHPSTFPARCLKVPLLFWWRFCTSCRECWFSTWVSEYLFWGRLFTNTASSLCFSIAALFACSRMRKICIWLFTHTDFSCWTLASLSSRLAVSFSLWGCRYFAWGTRPRIAGLCMPRLWRDTLARTTSISTAMKVFLSMVAEDSCWDWLWLVFIVTTLSLWEYRFTLTVLHFPSNMVCSTLFIYFVFCLMIWGCKAAISIEVHWILSKIIPRSVSVATCSLICHKQKIATATISNPSSLVL